ncbi:MAG: ribosomal-processing cysteine protease Prp [Clostridiales bacterium]|nr:ribosomal-processing cysteine protease Prp [Clostridiales bacterium]
MIQVKFFKKNGKFYYFESKGHADFDEHGKDIVCAAISVLAQTLVNGILEISTIDPIVEVDEESGYLKCELPKDQSVLENIEIQTAFRIIKVGIEGISEVYDEYVELLEEEV